MTSCTEFIDMKKPSTTMQSLIIVAEVTCMFADIALLLLLV